MHPDDTFTPVLQRGGFCFVTWFYFAEYVLLFSNTVLLLCNMVILLQHGALVL